MIEGFHGFEMFFLKYFQDWLNSIQQCQENFIKGTDKKMFILWQTLTISVNQIIEATQFLLWHQVKYVMENAFVKILSKTGLVGKISLGSRKDNPSMVDFGYNNNAIRNQKHFKPIASLSLMLLILAWLPSLTSHFHVENLKKN